MELIEQLLGREPNITEKMIWEMFKDNKAYHFAKDKNGNLIANKNK